MTKLLIVDDDALIAEEIGEYLNAQGFTCISCNTAEAALQLFTQHADIGIVLSDLRLPQLSGIDLVRDLNHRFGRERHFEAMIFTGQAEREDIIQAMRAGVADFYQKPIDLEQLLDAVKRLEQRLKLHQAEQHLGSQLEGLANSLKGLYPLTEERREPPSSAQAYGEEEDVVGPPFDNLSPRQLAVARQVARGLTNYQIACELGITENTVKLYVSQVLRLTGMHNRTQLALSLSPNRNHRANHS